MAQTLTRPVENHLMKGRDCVDALTGEEYRLWVCPICGRTEKEMDGATTVLTEGDAPTAEDATKFAELAQTPAGRIELSGILRRYPGHDKRWIDQDAMLALAAELGVDAPVTTGPPVVLRFR